MKAIVTRIEDTGMSNLLRVHHERPGEDGKIEHGFETHSRFSTHIPSVGDEIDVGAEEATAEEPAADETEHENAAAE